MTARMIARRLLLAGLAAAALAGAVSAHGLRLRDPLAMGHPWSLALAPGAPAAAGYLTIANAGPEPDRLVAASSPAPSGSNPPGWMCWRTAWRRCAPSPRACRSPPARPWRWSPAAST